MKTLLALLLILALAGCAKDEPVSPPTTPTTPTTPTATPPKSSPPTSPEGAPPPAWLESDSGSYWLGFSTFCWTSLCADYIAPTCGAPHVPTLVLKKGERVRVHLGFKPKQISLDYFDGKPIAGPKLSLENPSFTVTRAGVFSLFVGAAEGEEGDDASYVGCVRFAN